MAQRSDFYARDLPARYPRVFCVPFLRRERCADSGWQCRSLCSPKHRASSWWRWSSWGPSPRKRPRGILTAWDTQPRSDALTESAWFSCFICCAANTQIKGGKNPCRKWLKWKSSSGPWILKSPKVFQRSFGTMLSKLLCLAVPGWSLYTCGPVCLPAPRRAQQRRRGGISKRAPLYGNGHLNSARSTAFHNVCVMIMTREVWLRITQVTHRVNNVYPQRLMN